MPRAEFNAGAVLREGFLGAFEHDAQKLQEQGKRINIFFSFTTDLYHPGDTTPSRRVLELAHKYGHTFTVLTKGGSRALRDIDLYQENDHFAATLTVLDNNFVSKWERDAAPWQDRIAALVKFHRAGIFTWVSIEPGFNADSSIAILEELSSVVDFFKIGRANYLPITTTTDWRDYTLRILDTVTRLGVQAYFKKDLQEFLPTGTPNQP